MLRMTPFLPEKYILYIFTHFECVVSNRYLVKIQIGRLYSSSCLWPESQGLYYHLLKLQVNTHNHLKPILKTAISFKMPTGLMLNLDRLDLPWTEYIQGGNIFFSLSSAVLLLGGVRQFTVAVQVDGAFYLTAVKLARKSYSTSMGQ